MPNVQPVVIHIEPNPNRGATSFRVDPPFTCLHPQVDIRVVGEGLAEVLCFGCGHEWRSVRVVVP